MKYYIINVILPSVLSATLVSCLFQYKNKEKRIGKIKTLKQAKNLIEDALCVYGTGLPNGYDKEIAEKLVNVHNSLNSIINELNEYKRKE